ncbi:MAG TPA: N-acetyltransferase [Candidatus Binatia bacterium]
MTIRPESPRDVAAIRRVNELAFGRRAEADIVDRLRERARPIVSQVAEDGGEIAGHILISPVTLASRPDLLLMGLAPLAVMPERQRQGIGSALVTAGLEECRSLGAAAVVVLGHAAYYPRFGFRPASLFGLRSEYDVADDVFMALELRDGTLAGVSGTVRYHPALDADAGGSRQQS